MKTFHGNIHNGKRQQTFCDGIRFDSKLEASYYAYLSMLKVEILDMQSRIYLTAARILFKPDFEIVDRPTGEVVWIDTKGFDTVISRVKQRLWKHYGPGTLRIVKLERNRFVTHKEILRVV